MLSILCSKELNIYTHSACAAWFLIVIVFRMDWIVVSVKLNFPFLSYVVFDFHLIRSTPWVVCDMLIENRFYTDVSSRYNMAPGTVASDTVFPLYFVSNSSIELRKELIK